MEKPRPGQFLLMTSPFCGGVAEEKITGRAPNYKHKVVCPECGCRTGETVASPLHIRTWNRRVDYGR